jgi:hypothetical protein
MRRQDREQRVERLRELAQSVGLAVYYVEDDDDDYDYN